MKDMITQDMAQPQQTRPTSSCLFIRKHKKQGKESKFQEIDGTCKNIFTKVNLLRCLADASPCDVEYAVKDIWMSIVHSHPTGRTANWLRQKRSLSKNIVGFWLIKEN